jgi:hypothetical protein
MSTAERIKPRAFPPLENGQHLDQPTFHERYQAMPEGTWAELVGGVVYTPSPVSLDHAEQDDNVGGWLFHYKLSTKLFTRDLDRLIRVLEQGLASPEHVKFVGKLAAAGAGRKPR